MDINDFYRIVDDYSNDAFSACIHAIYEDLNLNKNIDEITKKDLKEQLRLLLDTKKPTNIYLEHFATDCSHILEYHINPTEGTIVDRYQKKGIKCLRNLQEKNGSISDIENFMLVYIPLFKKYKLKKTKNDEPLSINNCLFELKNDDIDILRYIKNNIKIIYRERTKDMVKVAGNWINGVALGLSFLPRDNKSNSTDIFNSLNLISNFDSDPTKIISHELLPENSSIYYIISVLFFYKMLQYKGEI